MNSPRLCAVITADEPRLIEEAGRDADLFEVRIDLLGEAWPTVAKRLNKPWIACNRSAGEGGGWKGSETERIGALSKAIELGAQVIDIELATEGLGRLVKDIQGKVQCLISFHDFERTPPLAEMRRIIDRQVDSGADICKLVTTARQAEDNLAVIELVSSFPGKKVVSFAMGQLGLVSRVLSPLAGGYFTYASLAKGRESAAGQITIGELRKLYRMLGYA